MKNTMKYEIPIDMLMVITEGVPVINYPSY